jgi:hypothetical protein
MFGAPWRKKSDNYGYLEYANAVVHGEPAIALTLRACGGAVAGAVTDHGARDPRLLAASLDEFYGRGLGIVAALADRWEADPLSGGTGKTVWFILRIGRRDV